MRVKTQKQREHTGCVGSKQQAPRPAPPINCNVRILINLFLRKKQKKISNVNHHHRVNFYVKSSASTEWTWLLFFCSLNSSARFNNDKKRNLFRHWFFQIHTRLFDTRCWFSFYFIWFRRNSWWSSRERSMSKAKENIYELNYRWKHPFFSANKR